MMTAILIPCHPGNLLSARYCALAARAVFPAVHITALADAGRQSAGYIPDQTAAFDRFHVSTFDRGGNLNGRAAIEGILRALLEAADASGADAAMKMDPDTLWHRPPPADWGTTDADAVWCLTSRPGMCGMCYRLSVPAIKAVLQRVSTMDLPPGAPEDLTIGNILMEIGARIRRMPLHPDPSPEAGIWRWATTNWPAYEDFAVINYGVYPSNKNDYVAEIQRRALESAGRPVSAQASRPDRALSAPSA